MEENQKKAFDFAAETTKQLITISTAIITLTVAFSRDILGGAENSPKTLLVSTWTIFILSIICGVLTLMALTGTLQPILKKNGNKNYNDSSDPEVKKEEIGNNTIDKININNGNIRLFSGGQAFFFITAIIMTGLFGYKSLSFNDSKLQSDKEYKIIRHSTLNNDTTTIYIDTLYLPTEKSSFK
jgi:hypothetical protein